MSRAFGFTANAYRGPAMYGLCGCKSAGGTARHCGIVSGAPADTPYCACQCHGVTPYEEEVLPAGHLPYVFGGEERYIPYYAPDTAVVTSVDGKLHNAPIKAGDALSASAGTLTVTKVERNAGVMTVAPEPHRVVRSRWIPEGKTIIYEGVRYEHGDGEDGADAFARALRGDPEEPGLHFVDDPGCRGVDEGCDCRPCADIRRLPYVVRLRDSLGEKDSRIRDLERENAQLALELRRAGRRGR